MHSPQSATSLDEVNGTHGISRTGLDPLCVPPPIGHPCTSLPIAKMHALEVTCERVHVARSVDEGPVTERVHAACPGEFRRALEPAIGTIHVREVWRKKVGKHKECGRTNVMDT